MHGKYAGTHLTSNILLEGGLNAFTLADLSAVGSGDGGDGPHELRVCGLQSHVIPIYNTQVKERCACLEELELDATVRTLCHIRHDRAAGQQTLDHRDKGFILRNVAGAIRQEDQSVWAALVNGIYLLEIHVWMNEQDRYVDVADITDATSAASIGRRLPLGDYLSELHIELVVRESRERYRHVWCVKTGASVRCCLLRYPVSTIKMVVPVDADLRNTHRAAVGHMGCSTDGVLNIMDSVR